MTEDLEILVTWDDPGHALFWRWVQESTDGVNWNTVAVSEPGATNCIVRGCGINGSNFLQERTSYMFRVSCEEMCPATAIGIDPNPEWSLSSGFTNVRTPRVTVDNGLDMIVLIGGRNSDMSQLLSGISINTDPSGPLLVGQGTTNSMGKVWADLVNKGYNAFLAADPEDGGSIPYRTTEGTIIKETLDNDGSGRLYDEIQREFQLAIVDLGLIGYSHGGGMTENISNRLKVDSTTPSSAQVVFADTIDGIQYGTGVGGEFVTSPMTVSPAAIWGGFGFNYWEPNGTSRLGIHIDVHGETLTGAYNYPPFVNLTHSTIGTSAAVLSSVETDCDDIYDMLSGRF